MPFKFHETQRRHIPKARYRVQNWPDYDRGLVLRGDVRVWLWEDTIAGWRAACRTTPGGQRRFSNLAIETTLVLGAVLRLPLRQTEGFVRSLMALMKLELGVLDHTTLARRRRTVDVCERRWRPERGPSILSSTAPTSSSSVPANGPELNMAKRGAPGASCTFRSIPAITRSSPMN